MFLTLGKVCAKIRRYRRDGAGGMVWLRIAALIMVAQYNNLIPYADLPTATEPIARVANGLRVALCGLHSRVPYAYRALYPNPVSDTLEEFWNGVCDRPASPTTNVPATALGCVGTTYRVTATYTFFGDPRFVSEDYAGQVVNAFWQPQAPDVVPGINNVIVRFCDGTDTILSAPDSTAPPNFVRETVSIQALGVEGSNCCAVVPPPPVFNELPPTLDIDIGTGPITIPVQFPDINIDVNGDLIGFRPVIITPIGQFNFILPGVVFSPRINLFPDITIPLTGGQGDGSGATVGEVQEIVDRAEEGIIDDLTQTIIDNACDLTPIEDLVNGLQFEIDLATTIDLIECYIRNGGGAITSQVLAGSTAGDKFNVPSGTFAIAISLQGDLRPGTRTQSGGGLTSTVVFWGWYSLNYVDGTDGQRMPLNYLSQSIPVPPGVITITVSPTFANLARVEAFRLPVSCAQPVTFPVPVTQPGLAASTALGDRPESDVISE